LGEMCQSRMSVGSAKARDKALNASKERGAAHDEAGLHVPSRERDLLHSREKADGVGGAATALLTFALFGAHRAVNGIQWISQSSLRIRAEWFGDAKISGGPTYRSDGQRRITEAYRP